jgi:RING finger/CHY zinc finger protein 1
MSDDMDVEMLDSDEDLLGDETEGSSGSLSMFNAAGTDSATAAAPVVQDESAEEDSAKDKRRAIQAIMKDASLSAEEKRMRIQNLMSGNRLEVAAPPAPVIPEHDRMNCVHYERNCSIIAPCCGRICGCRLCHDENSPSGHPPMDRFMIREVICKRCTTRQPASNLCTNCGMTFGEYHCGICNLWMAQSKKPFHCAECGFCRVGGVENFRHCNECCMCISVHVFQTHNCFKDKYKNNCPVCREDMFSSRQSPQDLPCGHAIHAHCFRKLASFDYRCPICKKTVVSQQSMAAAWEARARDIAEQPMPPDLERVVDIMCNDCETKSRRRNWHFLGVQCPHCRSFNTVVENVVSTANEGEAGAVASANNGGSA